jgi:hypothetical protein
VCEGVENKKIKNKKIIMWEKKYDEKDIYTA